LSSCSQAGPLQEINFADGHVNVEVAPIAGLVALAPFVLLAVGLVPTPHHVIVTPPSLAFKVPANATVDVIAGLVAANNVDVDGGRVASAVYHNLFLSFISLRYWMSNSSFCFFRLTSWFFLLF